MLIMEMTIARNDVNRSRMTTLKDVILRHRVFLHDSLFEALIQQGASPVVTERFCRLAEFILDSLDQPAATCELDIETFEDLTASEILRAMALWTEIMTECFAQEFVGSNNELAYSIAALNRWMTIVQLRILHEQIQKSANKYLEQLNRIAQSTSALLPRLETMQGEHNATY